jgi:hypothetical protein
MGCCRWACLGVSRKEAVSKEGRRGARKTVPSQKPGEHAALHEPLPMKPLVPKGLGKGGDGGGVDGISDLMTGNSKAGK